jgi:hypothetical protein
MITGWATRIRFPTCEFICAYPTTSRPALGSRQPMNARGGGRFLSPGMNLPKLDAVVHSFPYSAKAQNAENYE